MAPDLLLKIATVEERRADLVGAAQLGEQDPQIQWAGKEGGLDPGDCGSAKLIPGGTQGRSCCICYLFVCFLVLEKKLFKNHITTFVP